MTAGASDAGFDLRVLGSAAQPPGPEVRAAWEALYRTSPHRTPYARLGYGRAVAEALGVDYVVHGAFEREALVGGVLHFERRRLGVRQGVVPPFTLYTPVLQAAPATEAAIHAGSTPIPALLRAVRARCPGGAALHLPPTEIDARPYVWAGWTARPLYTYRLPLTTSAAWLAACSSSTRRQVRKAVDAFTLEITSAGAVESQTAREAARVIASLCHSSYARHERTPPAALHALEQLVVRAYELGLADLLIVRTAVGDPAAGVALLTDGTRATYWVAGSEPGPGMTALFGLLVPHLIDAGYEDFDLVGANTPSIAEFKRRLGGSLHSYLRVESTPPVWRLLRTVRTLSGGGRAKRS